MSHQYDMPLEDILFISLNISGISLNCKYNRVRTALRLNYDQILFNYAIERKERDYYFALPVNMSSSFVVEGNTLLLDNIKIGQLIGLTEDICDSHYMRRNGSSLNINPNSRTSCRGCDFCYTAYQVPYDRKRLANKHDLEEFFQNWIMVYNLSDLSHLIQISVVTGCYESSDDLCRFLLVLKQVVEKYRFKGKIFYLGSQIAKQDDLSRLTPLQPFTICYSIESFERRELLRETKRVLNLKTAQKLMDFGMELGFEMSFSYIIGLESLDVIETHFEHMKGHINKFPIINTLQLHKYHTTSLIYPDAVNLEYYLKARKLLERMFSKTNLRPLVWENYRSLWFLKFGKEPLLGIRTP